MPAACSSVRDGYHGHCLVPPVCRAAQPVAGADAQIFKAGAAPSGCGAPLSSLIVRRTSLLKLNTSPRDPTMNPDPHKSLREHLLYLLRGGGAHLHFDKAVADIPPELRGRT